MALHCSSRKGEAGFWLSWTVLCWLDRTRMQRGCVMYGFSPAVPSHLPVLPEPCCGSSLLNTTLDALTPRPPPQSFNLSPDNGKSARMIFLPQVTPHPLISKGWKAISYPCFKLGPCQDRGNDCVGWRALLRLVWG